MAPSGVPPLGLALENACSTNSKHFFDHFCTKHGCKLTVVNQEQLSPQQEMVGDLMAIIHCFSSRLYGLRSYKQQIKEAAEHG
jgi:predicted site-specific integrase-resolvase